MHLSLVLSAGLGVGTSIASPVMAAPLAQDVYASNSRYPPGSYWDRISRDHPSCAELIATHYQMTLDLRALDKRAKATVSPAQSQVVRQLNDLARRRTAVGRQITACVRASLQAQAAQKRARRPPLQGGAEQNDGGGDVRDGGPTLVVEDPPPWDAPDPPLRPGVPTPGIPTPDVPTIPGDVGDGTPPTRRPPTNRSPSPSNPRARRDPPAANPPRETPRSRTIFNYYYINGVNTPLTGDGRGNATWDRQLIAANLLDKGARVGQIPQRGQGYATRIRVADEIDVMAPLTHNPSGKDPSLPAWLRSFCTWASGTRNVSAQVATGFCALADWWDDARANGADDQAGGDILECARQALETFPGVTGITFSAEHDVVKEVTRAILETYGAERERQEVNYFIVIAHSQGNFFGEGVAYRLMSNLENDRVRARQIFDSRLGILSLGSPTSYDSLPPEFRNRRVRHFTRADDAIVGLRVFGGQAKKPWPASADLPALWPWQPARLQAALRIAGPDGKSPFVETMQLKPPSACKCPEPDAALYTPLMNSHLMENYLADPALTEPGRTITTAAAAAVGLPRAATPATTSVLGRVRFGLYQLKQELLAQ